MSTFAENWRLNSLQSQKSLDESLYDDELVRAYHQSNLQPSLSIDDFVSLGYWENDPASGMRIFKPIQLHVDGTGSDAQVFTIEHPGNRQWYQRLLHQVCKTCGINTGIDLLYGATPISEYPIHDIISWPRYSVRLAVREFDAAPTDPDSVAKLRKASVVNDQKALVDAAERRFARQLSCDLYKKFRAEKLERARQQVQFVTHKPKALQAVVTSIREPAVYASNNKEAFSQFCENFGVKNQGEFVNDVTQRLIQCACNSSWHKTRKNKKKSKTTIGEQMEPVAAGSDVNEKTLEKELIGCGIFGYIRGMCRNAWHCKSTKIPKCQLRKKCYGHEAHSDTSSCTSSSSSSSSSSGTDTSDCSSSDNETDYFSSDDEGTYHSRHRRNAVRDPYKRYFAPYRDYSSSDCSSSSSSSDEECKVRKHHGPVVKFCGAEQQEEAIGAVIPPMRSTAIGRAKAQASFSSSSSKGPIEEVVDTVAEGVEKRVKKAAKSAGKLVEKAKKKTASKKKKKAASFIGAAFYETEPSVEQEMMNETITMSGAELLAQGQIIGTVMDCDEPPVEPVRFAHVQEAATSAYSRVESEAPIGGVYEEDEEDNDVVATAAAFTTGSSVIPPMPDSVPLVAEALEEEEEEQQQQDNAAVKAAEQHALSQSTRFQQLFKEFKIGDALDSEFGADQDFVVFAPSDASYSERMHKAVSGHSDPEYAYKYAKHYVCQSCDNGGDFDQMKIEEDGSTKYRSIGGRMFNIKDAKLQGIQSDMEVVGQFFHPDHENVEFVVYNGLHNAVPRQ